MRKAGNRLRITTELVSASEGFQLWSERYDRQAGDVFAIQEEIATAIARKPKVALAADAKDAGRMDDAFHWMERAYTERDLLPLLNHWPQTGAFRDDPQFDALMRRIGVPGRD